MTVSHVIFPKLLLTVFVCSVVVASSDIGLPMIQINHDGDEDYTDLEEEQIHLEDFFWTGSGDGPPIYVNKIHTGISKGKDVIVKTNTVVATVYVEGNNEVDIPICLDCFPDNGFNIPLNFSSTDRRYWLLTVISGFYSTKDRPMLEEKLAKLYRLAFTRQQSKHLGIGNGLSAKGATLSVPDRRPNPQVNINEKDTSAEVYSEESDYDEIKRRRRRRRKKRKRRELQTETYPEFQESSSSSLYSFEIDEYPEERNQDHDLKTVTDSTIEPTTQIAYELLNPQNNNETRENLLFQHQQSPTTPHPKVNKDSGMGNIPPELSSSKIFSADQVRIVIHNVTQITEEDIQSGGLPSIIRTSHNEDINEKIDERPLANQTEIIYSVFVGGRPVLAVTAANDMKLVSELEVTSIMGKDVFMKAEPYVREPMATPLAPATRSSNTNFLASVGENTLLIVIGSLVIILLLVVLVALLLMGKPRKQSEIKRASSRNELLADGKSSLNIPPSRNAAATVTGTVSREQMSQGIHNLSYENETTRNAFQHHGSRSRRGSTSSTDNTSDSSVYTPINPPPVDVQRMLDEKAATLFDKRRRRQSQHDQSATQEAIYTSVISERKKDKRHSSNSKNKTKRKYLSENRVGSIEDAPHHSSTETTASNESIVEALRPNYQNFERTEAFNPHNNYHKNKLLQNRIFTDKIYDTVPDELPTQAINREIIRALQPSEKSSETGSIGSFLSMASVKSFPKHSLPEPLNRVLEPVFVTYYDNVEETIQKPPRKKPPPKSPLTEAVATIERFPEPKAPRSMRTASQSDNPDPGVVGPIVWEIHKKRMASENDHQDIDVAHLSPLRDPAETRNHFQGLLEGAMQMYSSQDDLPTPLPTKNFTNQRKRINQEFRGKSAGSKDQPKSLICPRPSTAQPEKTSVSNHSTQPPSPNLGAWGSGGVHQPLVRPLSAGPFHRPDVQTCSHGTGFTISEATNYEDLSAAPLIEAIQNELKKFKREN